MLQALFDMLRANEGIRMNYSFGFLSESLAAENVPQIVHVSTSVIGCCFLIHIHENRRNSAQTTLVVDVLGLVWWALHTSWSELWRCMKKRSWHGVYFTSIKVNTEMFFWQIWELSCRMLPSLVNTCASCRLSASVAKSNIYGIKLKFLTKFLNRIYKKFEQREAIRTFCSENLEHVLSLLRGPVYWIIEFLGPKALQCFTFML